MIKLENNDKRITKRLDYLVADNLSFLILLFCVIYKQIRAIKITYWNRIRSG